MVIICLNIAGNTGQRRFVNILLYGSKRASVENFNTTSYFV
jgi:hypothetical protein